MLVAHQAPAICEVDQLFRTGLDDKIAQGVDQARPLVAFVNDGLALPKIHALAELGLDDHPSLTIDKAALPVEPNGGLTFGEIARFGVFGLHHQVARRVNEAITVAIIHPGEAFHEGLDAFEGEGEQFAVEVDQGILGRVAAEAGHRQPVLIELAERAELGFHHEIPLLVDKAGLEILAGDFSHPGHAPVEVGSLGEPWLDRPFPLCGR